MNKTSSNLPAGIINGSLELYRQEGEAYAMLDGHKCKYCDLPVLHKLPFQNEFFSDEKAREALWEMGIPENKQEEMFVACRYGNYDNTPDLNDGVPVPDAPKCSKILECKGFGKVCLVPGNLSKREYIIVIEVANGKLDKEIAQSCRIELSTIRTYLSRIREKLHLNNRTEIALWAHTRNIV